jgi:GNAT superfamily N-acetyltransferase
MMVLVPRLLGVKGENMQEISQSVRLTDSQVEMAVRALNRAFMTDDPVWTFLFPGEFARTEMLDWMFNVVVRYSLQHGQVYTTPDISGAACWLPPGKAELKYFSLLRLAGMPPMSALYLGADGMRNALDAMMHTEKLHKKLMRGKHWYLWLLGVEPEQQGQGIGSLLLEPVLSRADQEGCPCYLETQTEENVAFYRNHGFEVVHEGELPNQGPMIWNMVRQPGAGSV